MLVFQHAAKTGGSSLVYLLSQIFGKRACRLVLLDATEGTRETQCVNTFRNIIQGRCSSLEIHPPDETIPAFVRELNISVHSITIARHPLNLTQSMYNFLVEQKSLHRLPQSFSKSLETLLGSWDHFVSQTNSPNILMGTFAGYPACELACFRAVRQYALNALNSTSVPPSLTKRIGQCRHWNVTSSSWDATTAWERPPFMLSRFSWFARDAIVPAELRRHPSWQMPELLRVAKDAAERYDLVCVLEEWPACLEALGHRFGLPRLPSDLQAAHRNPSRQLFSLSHAQAARAALQLREDVLLYEHLLARFHAENGSRGNGTRSRGTTNGEKPSRDARSEHR